MIQVPDAASIATMLWLEKQIRRRAGPSTGTNLWGALQVAQEMEAAGRSGSVVTVLCDDGNRYLDTFYNPEWVMEHIGDTASYTANLEKHLS